MLPGGAPIEQTNRIRAENLAVEFRNEFHDGFGDVVLQHADREDGVARREHVFAGAREITVPEPPPIALAVNAPATWRA